MSVTHLKVHTPPVTREGLGVGGKTAKTWTFSLIPQQFPQAWVRIWSQGWKQHTRSRWQRVCLEHHTTDRVRPGRCDNKNDHRIRNGSCRGGSGVGTTVLKPGLTQLGCSESRGTLKSCRQGLSQGAHPSFWAEGPIGRTLQQPTFYWPHWVTQGHQAL